MTKNKMKWKSTENTQKQYEQTKWNNKKRIELST